MGKNMKQGKKEDDENKDIVLKAFMHCEGCSEKVSRCLKGFDGVEQVVVDRANQKVIVRGKMADPVKVLERLGKKYSKNVELISPKGKAQVLPPPPPPPLKTLILKMYIHCEGCANDIQKSIQKMKGVVCAEVNKEKSRVSVRGAVEAPQLIQYIKKRLGKHADIENQEREPPTTPLAEHMILFSYPSHYLDLSQTFSDENVFSCSLM